MNEHLDLQTLTMAILRRWLVVIVVTAAIASLGYVVSKEQAPTYEATTSVLVGQERVGAVDVDSDRATKEQLALTFAEFAVRAPVLEPAADALGIEGGWRSLRSRVRVQLAQRTLLLDVVVADRSPEAAEQAADEVADQLVLVSEPYSPYVQVKVGPARADPEPVAPNVRMNTLFTGIIGFILASALALVLELARIRRKRAFRSNDEVPFLGVVTVRRGAGSILAPDRSASEEAASILGLLRVACRPHDVRTILVTGSSAAERSRVSSLLAVTLAHAGTPTALVDLGFRDPILHRMYGVPLEPGVAELLEQGRLKQELSRPVHERLRVLPAGSPSGDPALLLSVAAIDRIIAEVKSLAEVVVFDLPLTERLAEVGLVSERVDALVLVMRSHVVRNEERRPAHELTAIGVSPTGIVVVERSLGSRLPGGAAKAMPIDEPADESDEVVAVADEKMLPDGAVAVAGDSSRKSLPRLRQARWTESASSTSDA